MDSKVIKSHQCSLEKSHALLIEFNSELITDANIRADFVGKFSACYGGRPHGRFSNFRFGATLKFKLIAGFYHK